MAKELEIYLHIPFCVQKCGYCDFLSAPAKPDVQRRYVDRLIEEIQGFESAKDYRVSTVFLGGGTPSILPGEQIERILDAVRTRFLCPEMELAENEWTEVTVECNPGTLDMEKLRCYRRAGVNRLSIGLQSADNGELACLGRIHTYESFLESYRLAREAGFENINVDVMSALPGQTVERCCDTLRKVCALSPEHISAYSLIVEEGTPFFERYGEDVLRLERGEQPQSLPSEKEERRMYRRTQDVLAAYGYCRYEISNYAKPGFACRHNAGYWRRVDYAGFGLGAASLLNPLRYRNTSDLAEYLGGDFSKREVAVLTKDDQIEETMFLGLRMMDGVDVAGFEKTFSCPVYAVYGPQIDRLKGQGLLLEEDGRLRLTKRGIDISNRVLAEFLLE